MRAPQPVPSSGRIIVLDTAALIAGTDTLYALGNLYPQPSSTSLFPSNLSQNAIQNSDPVSFYTVPDVVREVKDQRARARLALLDGSIVLRVPSSEAMAATIAFAKATGNYNALSLTDLRVIALCWMLAVEHVGLDKMPSPPTVARPKHIGCGKNIPFEHVERMEQHREQEERKKQMENLEEGGWTIVSKSKEVSQSQEESDNIDHTILNVVPGERIMELEQNDCTESKEISSVTEKTVTSEDCQSKSYTAVHEKEELVHIQNVNQLKDLSLQNNEDERLTEHSDKLGKQNSLNDVEEPTSSPGEKEKPVQRRRRRRHRKKKQDISKDEITPSVGETEEESPTNIEPTIIAENEVIHMTSEEIEESEAIRISETLDPTDQSIIVVEEEDNGDDDGGGWINEDNLEEHLARDAGEAYSSMDSEHPVCCVTTDFAMQSTMLQMGLRLLSVDGRRNIQRIKHFALRCQSCNTVTTELHRKFCEKCGNASFHRVAYKIDKNGRARAFLNPKKQPILRGTKYSIPMPRGGRHNKDLILCEDQIDPIKQRRIEKQREKLNVDVLDPSNFYNAGARFNPHNKPLIVGYGRRNPNEVRPSTRHKR